MKNYSVTSFLHFNLIKGQDSSAYTIVCFIRQSLVPVCLLVLMSHPATYSQTNSTLAWVKNVGARKAPSTKSIYLVNNYGAIEGGKTIATKAVQAAIDACAKKGGGVVSFKPGIYLMGAVFLKSNVLLWLKTAASPYQVKHNTGNDKAQCHPAIRFTPYGLQ